MKKTRLFLTASLLAIGSLSAVTMTSCSKDDTTCAVGYEGKDCKTLSRDKFIGQWQGHEDCTIGTDDYSITLTASGTSEVKLIYTNVYNQAFTATGEMTGTNGFTFSGTAAGTSGTVNFSGNVSLDQSTGKLTSTYMIKDGVNPDNSCTFTGTKL
ncbi:hypothetical protein F0919_16895 [Taibaiella lutea]|uniref:Lipocalin-like domain-containing protein n=1 Tax=Taibaiella lutea TaxID=2608001 RepID=A0A5M6CG96_9BACT|nr:hypothetical protein [Taibaiella lutea]KAA5532465.1 hypothetical protein F0919_16895 [Taibaiella lutea]